MLVENGVVTSVGPARRVENLAGAKRAEEVDASGVVVMPGFVDSHTHLVHGPPRLSDYEARLEGKTYEEIAAAGGGIGWTVRAVRQATAQRLERQASADLLRMASCGTTTVEAKSGYGLDLPNELKTLRLLRELNGCPLEIVPTFLGAHVTPPEFRDDSDGYIEFLTREALPAVARKKLACFADVYCDEGAFNYAQALKYLRAAKREGLEARIHAAQFEDLGAARLALETNARSVDHLEALDEEEIGTLARSATVATLLPGSVLHLGLQRYAPARALIDEGAAVALATDFNPGTSPTWNMQMAISLACSQMRMTPAEAITAATVNGAAALGLEDRAGTLEAGRPADFLILNVCDYREIPYYFGANHVRATYKAGVRVAPGKELNQP